MENANESISILERMSEITSLVKSIVLLDTILKWIRPDSDLQDKQALVKRLFCEDIQEENLYRKWMLRDIEVLLPILIKCKGDVEFTDENGQTIMHLCILHYIKSQCSPGMKNRDADFVKKLLTLGASPIASDLNGDTPLGMALTKNRLDLVFLILGDCQKYGTNDQGETILHILIDKYNGGYRNFAAYIRMIRSEYIDRIIAYGKRDANINTPDKNGLTPVHLAAKHFYIEILMIFNNCRGIIDGIKTNRGDDTLIIACKNMTKKRSTDLFNVIRWLLNCGCDANSRNYDGFASLHYASRSCELPIIRILETHGANLNAVANDGTNALFSATMLSNLEVTLYLIKRGVTFDIYDKVYGFTLMHMAALNPDERIIDWFIEIGFDLNDPGRCGVTPLHLASLAGNAKIVKKLVDNGANVHCRDEIRQWTPLHLASMINTVLNVIDLVDSKPFKNDADSSLITHCSDFLKLNDETAYNYVINALLDAGADVNVKDIYERTPLHYATQQSAGDIIVETLLTYGAYVDVQDKGGYTPLHSSLINGKSIKVLLQFGADINDIEHPYENIYEIVTNPKNAARYYVTEHLNKLIAANQPINNVLYRTWEDGELFMIFENKYLDEVPMMKSFMLTSEVSLYDMLHMNWKSRLAFIDKLRPDLEEQFPGYYSVIRGSCYEALNRPKLLVSAKIAYELLTGSRWPDLCTELIFSFLNNKCLRALTDSVTE